MWVVRIRRCLRRSSTCERWVGVGGGIVSWCSACLSGFVSFLCGLLLTLGLFWLISGFLVCLGCVFVLLLEGC
jgi:hypothetical protein